MTKIWERLYLGSLKDAEQLVRSNPQRITTVVSLCREQAVHRAPKITYIHTGSNLGFSGGTNVLPFGTGPAPQFW